jgi:protein tyrosine phosphatase
LIFYDEFSTEIVFQNNTEHRVFHYYFTGWPDFSVVDQRKLLNLIETIDKHGLNSATKTKEDLLTPMVVHCRLEFIERVKRNLIFGYLSAGVGRTGTYIAVDIIRHLIDRSKNLSAMELDVMGIVYQLRQDRGKMVQTKVSFSSMNSWITHVYVSIGSIYVGKSLCRRVLKTHQSIR